MSLRLIQALEKACAEIVREAPRDASVMVQFAAGHWWEIREALKEARAQHDAANPPAPQPPAPEPAAAAPSAPAAPEAPAAEQPPPPLTSSGASEEGA